MRRLISALIKFLLIVALAVGVLFGVVEWLQRSGYFKDRLQRELAVYVEGEIGIENLDVSVTGRSLKAHGLTLHENAGSADDPAAAALRLEGFEVYLPLRGPQDGRLVPEKIVVRRPELALEERGETFSPLHLLKPPPPAETVPVVHIQGGTLRLSGEGPLDRLLDEFLRPDLPRVINDVDVTSWPVPESAGTLLGFRGTMNLPLVRQMSVGGRVGRDFSFDVQASLTDLPLDSDSMLDSLTQAAREGLEQYVSSGTVDVEFSLRTESGGEDASIGLRARARDLALQMEGLAAPVEFADADVSYDGRVLRLERSTARLGADEIDLDGRVEPVMDGETAIDLLGDFRASARGTDLSFGSGFAHAIEHPGVRRAIDDYSPQGTFDLAVDVGRNGEEFEARWAVVPREASASYVGHVREEDGKQLGFPYRLRELRGEVGGSGRRIEIRSLSGIHNGGGRAVVDGVVDLTPDGVSFDITIKGTEIPIDDTILAALDHLGPGSRDVFARFGIDGKDPNSSVDLDMRVWSAPGIGGSHHTGTVTVRRARVFPEWLPVELFVTGGRVVFEDGVYRAVGLVVERGGAKALLNGEVDASGIVPGSRERPGIDARLSVTSVPLDDPELRGALKITIARARAEQAAREGTANVAVDPSEPSPIDRWVPENGAADLELDLKGERGGPMKFRALLFPKGVEFVPEWLPLPIQGVIGRVEFGTLPPAGELADQGDQGFFLRLSDVRGRLNGAEVVASGRVSDGALQDLVVQGEEVEIDSRLLAALRERFRKLSSDSGVSTGAWADRVLPEGKVTFSLRYRHPDRSPDPTVMPIRLACHLSGSALMAPVGKGRRIDRLEADIEFDPNRRRLVVSDVSGRLDSDRGGISSDRLIVDLSSADGLRLSGDLVLDRVPFDAAITELILNDGLRRFLSERGPSGGTVAIVMPRVILELPIGQPGRVLSHESRVIITEGSLSRPAIDRINGVIVIAGDVVDGQLHHDGAVSDFAMRVLRPVAPMEGTARSGLDVTHARASIRVRPGRVDIDEITGEVAGGILPPANNRITILGGDDGVDGAILLDGASLRSVVGFVSEAKAEIDGRVRLELNFHGRTLAGINAHGLLSVDDGQLWELPVLSQVYRYTLGAALGSQSGPVFETGFVQYEVRDGRVYMQNLMLDAPVGPTVVGLKLIGSGEFDFQGNVRMRIDPQIISARIPIVSPVIDLLKRRLISYKVTGTFANPTIAYENPVGSLIGTLFPGSDEDLLERPRLPARGSLDWSKRF